MMNNIVAIEATNELQLCISTWKNKVIREAQDDYDFLENRGKDDDLGLILKNGGKDAIVRLEDFCQKGANLNYLEKERGFSCIPNVFWSEHLIQFFIDKGLTVNSQDENGDTALHLVLRHADFDEYSNDYGNLVKFLLKHFADPNISNLRGETALLTLAQNEKADYGEVKIWKAWKMLLQRGADVNARTCHGLSILHQYCSDISRRYIAEFNGDVDIRMSKCHYFQTPLMIAARCGNLKCCQLLIEKGADVNAKDLEGHTALHKVVVMGKENQKLAKFLVNQGADPLAKTLSGEDAYQLSIWSHDETVFTYGAEPQKQMQIFELAGAKQITRYLKLKSGFKFWEEGMEMCKKLGIQPEKEFLATYEFIKQNLENNAAKSEVYLAALKTVSRISSGNVKFWNLLSFSPTHYGSRYYKYVLINLKFLEEEFKRIEDFVTLDLTDLHTLSSYAQFFRIWSEDVEEHYLEVNEPKNDPIHGIPYLHTISRLLIACLNKVIEEIGSPELPSELFSELNADFGKALMRIHAKFGELISKETFEENEQLLKSLISLNLRDEKGNTLMHSIFERKCLFSKWEYIDTILDFGIVDVTDKNKAGFEPVQVISWEYRPLTKELKQVLHKMAGMGAHVDAKNKWGEPTLKEIFEKDEQYSSFAYDKLQCMCARVLAQSLAPYTDRVPKHMVDFIRMHNNVVCGLDSSKFQVHKRPNPMFMNLF